MSNRCPGEPSNTEIYNANVPPLAPPMVSLVGTVRESGTKIFRLEVNNYVGKDENNQAKHSTVQIRCATQSTPRWKSFRAPKANQLVQIYGECSNVLESVLPK
jgi:hypothetical protein